MKKLICAMLLSVMLVLPGLGMTEGDDTIQLARTLYTLGRDDSYETMLMLGSVVMNRVDSPWHPDTVKEVLGEPHQFPRGTIYDDESLRAAREIMMGRNLLPPGVVIYSAIDASVLPVEDDLYAESGNYGFYYGKR